MLSVSRCCRPILGIVLIISAAGCERSTRPSEVPAKGEPRPAESSGEQDTQPAGATKPSEEPGRRLMHLSPTIRVDDYGRRGLCKTRLELLGGFLQSYAREHGGRLPASIEELIRPADVAQQEWIRSPVPDAGPFTYVPGLTTLMPSDSIVVYDDDVLYGGKMCALRLGGRADALDPRELDEAIEKTRSRISAFSETGPR